MQKKAGGFLLILIGIIMIAVTGFSFVTTKKIADLGLVTINQKETHLIHWPPFIGAILLVIGIVLVVIDKK